MNRLLTGAQPGHGHGWTWWAQRRRNGRSRFAKPEMSELIITGIFRAHIFVLRERGKGSKLAAGSRRGVPSRPFHPFSNPSPPSYSHRIANSPSLHYMLAHVPKHPSTFFTRPPRCSAGSVGNIIACFANSWGSRLCRPRSPTINPLHPHTWRVFSHAPRHQLAPLVLIGFDGWWL